MPSLTNGELISYEVDSGPSSFLSPPPLDLVSSTTNLSALNNCLILYVPSIAIGILSSSNTIELIPSSIESDII